MLKSIAAFGEDFAHREIVGALIRRVAKESKLPVEVKWRSARRGHGKIVNELREYFRDIKEEGASPDLIAVATDANCKGLNDRAREIPTQLSPVTAVLAIPDPHVERWLLLDGAAFKEALGEGCRAPDQKCDRSRYKQELIHAVQRAGVNPNFGGIEFANDIIDAMDLSRAATIDPSMKRFLDALRMAFRRET
ncbi:hypothetical protein [Verrucomicrobium sp. 3C]|uniref:hypothetical protein n=1 Tax=Verrucomicrobium sp. 3C TaxID=1134055 RepID=UPI000371AAC2|nr:hypothetical protein [Verrucomicrobium sp. 3C]